MYYIFEKLLLEKGLRTVDVCKATGISQSTISNWKNRGNMLSPANLKLIAEFFGVSMDYLMGLEEEPNNKAQAESNKGADLVHAADNVFWEMYYGDPQTREFMEFLHKNPEYSILFDASTKVKPEDIKKALKAIGIFIDE